MKKSEALHILGLSEGANEDNIKAAHRKKVIASHPDKFAHDPGAYAEAEEKTKQINEARDVLLSGKWEPEYARRGPYSSPYSSGNGYGGGYSGYGRPAGSSGSSGQNKGNPNEENPFEYWPFGQGQSSWVWTSWDDIPGTSGVGNPFGFAQEPRKTAEERMEEAKFHVKTELSVVGVKILMLALFAVLGSFVSGLFLYVIVSLVYGLWKRLRACLIGFIVPITLVSLPFVTLIAPQAGGRRFALLGAFIIALWLDIRDIQTAVTEYRSLKSEI